MSEYLPVEYRDHFRPTLAIYSHDGRKLTGEIYKDGGGKAEAFHDFAVKAINSHERLFSVAARMLVCLESLSGHDYYISDDVEAAVEEAKAVLLG